MKLVTFEVATPVGRVSRIGAVLDGELEGEARIVDLHAGYAAMLAEGGDGRAYEIAQAAMPPDMIGYLQGGQASNARAHEVLDYVRQARALTGPAGEQLVYNRSGVRLLAPVPRPVTVRDFSTYEEHSGGNPDRAAWYFFPGCYRGNPGSIRGPEDDALYPAYTDWLDPELELGVYINKEGRNITTKDAMDFIGGYTIYIDLSARDTGPKDSLGPYKGKDFCTLTGPCLVTPDSFDENDARCGIRVNGETWYETNVGRLRNFFTPELIAYASDGETLLPGELLGSGTIGLGCSITLGKWLKPGDVLEEWIEGIGTIRANAVPEINDNSYVRNGIAGHLSLPRWAEGFPERLRDQQAEQAKSRMIPRGPRYERGEEPISSRP